MWCMCAAGAQRCGTLYVVCVCYRDLSRRDKLSASTEYARGSLASGHPPRAAAAHGSAAGGAGRWSGNRGASHSQSQGPPTPTSSHTDSHQLTPQHSTSRRWVVVGRGRRGGSQGGWRGTVMHGARYTVHSTQCGSTVHVSTSCSGSEERQVRWVRLHPVTR